MKTLLWLDDIRDPFEHLKGEEHNTWLVFSPLYQPHKTIWVKSYKEFTEWIGLNGLPDGICFDHDLGMEVAIYARSKGMSKRQSRKLKQEEKTGYDCAKWLVEYCLDRDLDIPLWNIQSANPVGKENINGILTNYKKYYNENSRRNRKDS